MPTEATCRFDLSAVVWSTRAAVIDVRANCSPHVNKVFARAGQIAYPLQFFIPLRAEKQIGAAPISKAQGEKALGITFPISPLGRADEVIE
jgi:hypothetical protein